MAVEVRIPAVDESAEEVRIVQWLKQQGQSIAAGEALLEVETDKAMVEIESFADGILLATFAKEEDTVPVNAVVAIVGRQNEDISELLEKHARGKAPTDN